MGVSDYCLTPDVLFFSHIMARTSYIQARSSLYANTQLRAHRRAEKKIKSKKIWKTDYQSQSPCRHAKTVLEISLYYAFIDHMIMELESRLIKSENRFYAEYLLPRVIGNITNEQIATLYETYQTDLTCNLNEFKREVARWRTRWSITPRHQMPTSLCETLDAVNPGTISFYRYHLVYHVDNAGNKCYRRVIVQSTTSVEDICTINNE